MTHNRRAKNQPDWFLSVTATSLPEQSRGQLVQWDIQLAGDPGGNGEARFALVLSEVGEIGLGHVCTCR
jgi:hypothetical protein